MSAGEPQQLLVKEVLEDGAAPVINSSIRGCSVKIAGYDLVCNLPAVEVVLHHLRFCSSSGVFCRWNSKDLALLFLDEDYCKPVDL